MGGRNRSLEIKRKTATRWLVRPSSCTPKRRASHAMLVSLGWSSAALLAMVAAGLALEEAASRQLLFLHLVPIGPSPFAADLNLNEPVLRCARPLHTLRALLGYALYTFRRCGTPHRLPSARHVRILAPHTATVR